MVGWHHPLNGHEFEQTLGESEGGKPSMLQSMGQKKTGHDLATKQQQCHQGVPPSRPHHLPKAPSPNTITLGVRISANLGGQKIQSITWTKQCGLRTPTGRQKGLSLFFTGIA